MGAVRGYKLEPDNSCAMLSALGLAKKDQLLTRLQSLTKDPRGCAHIFERESHAHIFLTVLATPVTCWQGKSA